MKTYREILIDNVKEMIEMQKEIFTQLLNLAMFGELKEINEVFETGDIYEFEIAQFENLSDTNVQKMVHLFKQFEQTIDSLINLNDISAEELDLDEDEFE